MALKEAHTARRTCRAGKIGGSFDGDICTHAAWPTRSPPEGGVGDLVAPFDVCLGNHQVGGPLVHAFLHNVSHCTHQGQLGDPFRLTIVGRPTVSPRCQASVSTVNSARITWIR